MNIVFIGMMGSGKTKMGLALSKKIYRKFVDTDKIFESRYGNINNYFVEKGESDFRLKESQIVKEVSLLKNVIISTGGGVVLNEANMENLKSNGIIILLDCSSKVIFQRTRRFERPILKNKDLDGIEALRIERMEKYKKYADLIIDANSVEIQEKIKIILDYLKEKGEL